MAFRFENPSIHGVAAIRATASAGVHPYPALTLAIINERGEEEEVDLYFARGRRQVTLALAAAINAVCGQEVEPA